MREPERAAESGEMPPGASASMLPRPPSMNKRVDRSRSTRFGSSTVETDPNFRWRSERARGGEDRFLRTLRAGCRSKRGGTGRATKPIPLHQGAWPRRLHLQASERRWVCRRGCNDRERVGHHAPAWAARPAFDRRRSSRTTSSERPKLASHHIPDGIHPRKIAPMVGPPSANASSGGSGCACQMR